jgi:hypothetical protein
MVSIAVLYGRMEMELKETFQVFTNIGFTWGQGE